MPRAFISHSHQDNAYCNEFAEALKSHGIDEWHDKEIREGHIFDILNTELLQCDHFVLIASPDAMKSGWVSREISAAINLQNDGKLLTFSIVVARRCEIPPLLSNVFCVQGKAKEALPPRVAATKVAEAINTAIKKNPGDAGLGTMVFIGRNDIEVKFLLSSKDPDVEKAIELYNIRFKDDEDLLVPSDDIYRHIDEAAAARRKHDHTMEELFLIAKVRHVSPRGRNDVAAFMNFQYYADSRYLFVSYLCVSKDFCVRNTNDVTMAGGPSFVVSKLLDAILYHLSSGNPFKRYKTLKQCRAILYEIELTEGEVRERRRNLARRNHFKGIVQRTGYKTFRLPIDYVQPQLSLDEHDQRHEEPLDLMYIPLQQQPGSTMTKAQVSDILRFIYFQVYGDSFLDDPEKDQLWREYLKSLKERVEATIPEVVTLV
jgi:hypothetical protein